MQRLRRIRQLGVGYLVFPGAEHTRFNHALGAMALMQETLQSLAEKGTPISPEEHLGAMAAALLHDIGHGPFSHTLEHELIADFQHEHMSRVLIEHLNTQHQGALTLALAIFDNTYARPFFHQLVSSQLDMDRLDYLRRDSFYTGVVEGRVGVERIIKTLRVHPLSGGPDANIVVESKGIYAAENFLLARRLMYWQVYLHKTVLAGDHLLRSILRRARLHFGANHQSAVAGCAPSLQFFLSQTINNAQLSDPAVHSAYVSLDDADLIYTLKQWVLSPDPILADLSDRFISRRFFRTTFLPNKPEPHQLELWLGRIAEWLVSEGLSTPTNALEDASFYLSHDRSGHAGYERVSNSIRVLERDGSVRELSEQADTAAIGALTRFEVKPYVCAPKEPALPFQLPE